MPTIASDLTRLRRKLNDTAAVLWTDAELLRWYVDGYRTLLADSQAVRRIIPFASPGRHTYAITQEWEDRHAARGSVRKMHRAAKAGTRQATGLWEVEHLDGVTPTNDSNGFTQEWERAHAGATERHFRFTFPHNHERIVRMDWQHRRLTPVSTRELDVTDTDWWQTAGSPRWWTTGAGRNRSVDLYELDTTDTQAYALYGYEQGFPRRISGSRTYSFVNEESPAIAYAYTTSGDSAAIQAASPPFITGLGIRITLATATSGVFAMFQWEVNTVAGTTPATATSPTRLGMFQWEAAFGATVADAYLGTIRRILSTTRQYLAVYSDAVTLSLCGRVVEWASDEDSILAIEVVVPDVALTTTDTPALIPTQLQKYLRYFVLGMAFGRVGEGRQPILADHYLRRFARGVDFFRRLGDVAHKDREWVRDEVAITERRLPRVRLPATFPSVW